MWLACFQNTTANALTCSVRRSLPPAWANMQALTKLEVNSNRLNGPLPDAWGANDSLPSLTTLNMVPTRVPEHARLMVPVERDVACWQHR